jgi:hypothetical protein
VLFEVQGNAARLLLAAYLVLNVVLYPKMVGIGEKEKGQVLKYMLRIWTRVLPALMKAREYCPTMR